MLCYVTPCYVALHCVFFLVSLFFVLLCNVLCCVAQCLARWGGVWCGAVVVLSCFAVLCYVLRYVMLCYVICYVMLSPQTQVKSCQHTCKEPSYPIQPSSGMKNVNNISPNPFWLILRYMPSSYNGFVGNENPIFLCQQRNVLSVTKLIKKLLASLNINSPALRSYNTVPFFNLAIENCGLR